MKTTSLLLLVAAASAPTFALPTDNVPIERRQQIGNGLSTSSLARASATPSVKATSSSGSSRAPSSTGSPAPSTSAAASPSRTSSSNRSTAGLAKSSAAAPVNNVLSLDFKAALGNGSTTRSAESSPTGTARSSPKPSAATLKPFAETGKKAFESGSDASTRKPIPSATALASGTNPTSPSRPVATSSKPSSTLAITYGSSTKCAQVQRVALQIAEMNRMNLPIPPYMAGLEMGLQDIVC